MINDDMIIYNVCKTVKEKVKEERKKKKENIK